MQPESNEKHKQQELYYIEEQCNVYFFMYALSLLYWAPY